MPRKVPMVFLEDFPLWSSEIQRLEKPLTHADHEGDEWWQNAWTCPWTPLTSCNSFSDLNSSLCNGSALFKPAYVEAKAALRRVVLVRGSFTCKEDLGKSGLLWASARVVLKVS